MELNIGINAQDRQDIASGLSKLLADSYSLYLKTHNYHWNVTGPQFNTLHTMFEQQYTELAAAVDEIAERIRGGADFADVALESSEDPGSRSQGGDLGFFPRGRMVPPFEEAAFSLEPGATSEVIRTTHGLHLIRVEERRAAMVVPFEEVRDEVRRDTIATRRREVTLEARAPR